MDSDLQWERSWWNLCTNTFGEESKQIEYAKRMGLKFYHDGRSPFNINMQGAKVLDVGGGPVSLLLKCTNVKGKVIDPCQYPQWIYERYKIAGIDFEVLPGEDIDETGYDECFIYNVLQHTHDPEKVISNMKKAAKVVRLFEWVDTYISKGHPHILTEEKLNRWFGGVGKVETLNGQGTCTGRCFYGVFLGD